MTTTTTINDDDDDDDDNDDNDDDIDDDDHDDDDADDDDNDDDDGNGGNDKRLFGRVIFGLGGESLSVCSSAIVSKWFAGQELAFALGINLSFSRLGSVANDLISPWAVEAVSLPFALLIGLALTAASLLAAVVLACMEG
jgi:hypothetical protein